MVAEAYRVIADFLVDMKPRVQRGNRRSGADLLVDTGRVRFLIECRASGDSASVGSAISQAREHAKLYGRGTVPVIAVGYMGEVGRRLCSEAKVSWFDLSGNAHIVGPGLLVHVDGKPNKFPRRGRPSTAFAPRSARVTRQLLLDPSRPYRQQELARATGLNDGFVSRIVRRLAEDDLVRRGDDGRFRVVDANLLLDAWGEAYDFSKHNIVKGHVTAGSGEKLLAQAAQVFSKARLRHAATGLGAAWVLTSFAGFRLVTYFVAHRPDDDVLRRLGFREEVKGANFWLVVPNDEGVFVGSEVRDGIACVHPVQAYLDLQAHPERAEEAAVELRSRLLRRKAW